MMRFAFLASLLVGCAEDPRQVLPEPAAPNFTLYVSNQSFEIDQVGIQVDLNGALAITGDFDVEGQHSFHEFRFELAPGQEHTIEARAHGDVLTATVTIGDDHDFALVSFWSADDNSATPYLDYLFSDDPLTFE
jgi:hypothetical protein